MANTVKKYARERRWLDVFMALGFLQRNILSCLRLHPERQDQAKLVIVGGWLQSGRCVTHMIKENYNDLASNILREPRLVAMIQEALEEVAPSCRNDERMKEITGRLPEIKKRVTVGFQEAVKKEDVEWLHKTFDDLVIEVTTGKAASKDQEPVAASSATAGTPGHGPAQNRGGAAQVAGSSDIGRQSSSQISHADSPQSAAGGHPEASGPLPDIEFQENGAPAALDGSIHWPRSPLPWLGGLLLALGILLGRILARRHKS
jgi:hypothetical protein